MQPVTSAMHSALFVGTVRHRRLSPVGHELRMPLFMAYLDLDELPRVLDRWPLASAHVPALAWFRRADYIGDRRTSIRQAVRDRIERAGVDVPAGPIRMLTHLRYLGHCFNPVTFYYCFDVAGAHVRAIVAEITNTPWKQRHAYVLRAGDAGPMRWRFAKDFHVSPLLPMDLTYEWFFTPPPVQAGGRLAVHMQLARAGAEGRGARVFDATLDLHRMPMTSVRLALLAARFPMMTAQVVAAIHWNALRLWLKGARAFPHPRTTPATNAIDPPGV